MFTDLTKSVINGLNMQDNLQFYKMVPRPHGDGIVREVIGPNGATDSHVTARLTSTVIPAGGQATIKLPGPDEDMFLYFVKGNGRFQSSIHNRVFRISGGNTICRGVALCPPSGATTRVICSNKCNSYVTATLLGGDKRANNSGGKGLGKDLRCA